MNNPTDHVRQRSAAQPAPGIDTSDYVNLSDAVRAANEDPQEQEAEAQRAPPFIKWFIASLVHIVNRIINRPRRAIRALLPKRGRHVLCFGHTDLKVLENNVDDTLPVRLGLGCWTADVTLLFTYQDFCGFCGSPIKNSLSTPRFMDGEFRAASNTGLLDGMDYRHRILLITTELIFVGGVFMMFTMGLRAYQTLTPGFEAYMTGAAATFMGYWLGYWQPRIGLLTRYGWMGRFVCLGLLGWILVTSTLNWGTIMFAAYLGHRLVTPY